MSNNCGSLKSAGWLIIFGAVLTVNGVFICEEGNDDCMRGLDPSMVECKLDGECPQGQVCYLSSSPVGFGGTSGVCADAVEACTSDNDCPSAGNVVTGTVSLSCRQGKCVYEAGPIAIA